MIIFCYFLLYCFNLSLITVEIFTNNTNVFIMIKFNISGKAIPAPYCVKFYWCNGDIFICFFKIILLASSNSIILFILSFLVNKVHLLHHFQQYLYLLIYHYILFVQLKYLFHHNVLP